MRFGHPSKGGAGQIKLHPFFKKVDWGAVYRKELTPPIVPEQKKGVQDLASGDANPYRLLEQNFDRSTVLEPVEIYTSPRSRTPSETEKSPNRMSERSEEEKVRSFTFDREAIQPDFGKFIETRADSNSFGSYTRESRLTNEGSRYQKQVP